MEEMEKSELSRYKLPVSSILTMEYQNLSGLPVNILKANQPHTEVLHKLIIIIPAKISYIWKHITINTTLSSLIWNPGLVAYYSEFVSALYAELDDGYTAVWAISHACHTVNNLGTGTADKDIKYNEPLNIETEHKLRFLESQIPPHCKITLIGHSIGCYMILSLLQILQGFKMRTVFDDTYFHSSYSAYASYYKNIYSRIDKCYFMFPTIERMKVSPSGQRLWPILKYFQQFVVFFITMVSWLPISLKRKVTSWIINSSVSSDMVNATLDLLTPRIFSNMLKLAYCELSEIHSLDIKAIQSVKDKIILYYGTTDGWCPLVYRDELLQAVPDIKSYVDDKGTEHAFVLKSSVDMAITIANMMNL